MNILGITSSFHDTSAALVRDGKLVAFVEEERLIRIKHAFGVFPEKAIEFCLQSSGLNFGDIDAIVGEQDMDLRVEFDPEMEPYKTIMNNNPSFREGHRLFFQGARDNLFEYAKNKGIKKALFAPHHHTHLATAYYGSGWDEALILSVDGRGETQSAVIAKGFKGNIDVLDEIPLPSSLGLLYATVTKYLGYTPFDGEGTVMGLAAYGQDIYRDFFDTLVQRDHHRFMVRYDAAHNELIDPGCKGIPCPLVDKFGEPRQFNPDPRNGLDENIAASLQACVERAVHDYVKHYIDQTGIRKLCIAGGVGLNSKMNGQLCKSLRLDDMYVFPVANDAGCAIGAAMWYAREIGGQQIQPVTNVYLGPSFSPDQIRDVLSQYQVTVEEPQDVTERAAMLLADHRIVGWFQGRMEGGPRALGARSILSNPTSIHDKDNVNNKVKFREPWRPLRLQYYMSTERNIPGRISMPPL